MELETIFESEASSAKYDRIKGILYATYKGLVKTDLAIQSFQAVVDALDKYPVKATIYNCMEMKGSFSNLNDFYKNVWYPALIPQGYICWAMATSDIFTKVAGSLIINKITPKKLPQKFSVHLIKQKHGSLSTLIRSLQFKLFKILSCILYSATMSKCHNNLI